MITQEQIRELAIKNRTLEINIAREYLQHLFLKYFYQLKGSDNFLFKGGTAIRIAFNGTRYSEDLDFSLDERFANQIEDLLMSAFAKLEADGITSSVDITDAVATSGGYLANIDVDILGYGTGLKSNIQVKEHGTDLRGERELISNAEFLPPYSLVILARDLLVREKIAALIYRSKPRDFFDLYFFLRDSVLKNYVPREEEILRGIKRSLERVSDAALLADLRDFIPFDQRDIIKALKTSLTRELGLNNIHD